MHSMRAVACAVLILAAMTPARGYAVNWNMGEHDRTEGGGPQGPRYNVSGSISQSDAMIIQDYYRSLAANGRCPAGTLPGAAGCTPASPSGRWVAGQSMSTDVPAEPLPRDLAMRLNPLGGFHYVRHGGDILLVVNGSEMVAAGMAIPVR